MAVLDDVKILLDIPEEETDLSNKLNLKMLRSRCCHTCLLAQSPFLRCLNILSVKWRWPDLTGLETKEWPVTARKGRALLMAMISQHIFLPSNRGIICRKTTQKEGCDFYEIRDTGYFCKRE